MDTYVNFQDLNSHEKEAHDFRIVVRDTDPRVAVMAIHGGGIEPGTTAIAHAIAGQDYSFYSFEGIKPSGNRILHLTANRFDEPIGVALAQEAEIVLSIHGCRESRPVVYVGGRDAALCARIQQRFKLAGFPVSEGGRAGLRGRHPRNICNRSRRGKGVQIEISDRLRKTIFADVNGRRRQGKSAAFFCFAETVRSAVPAAAEFKRACRPQTVKHMVSSRQVISKKFASVRGLYYIADW